MSIVPILIGIAASLLAVLQLAMWLAIGSFAIPRNLDHVKALPSALLIGSGITGAIYAILTYLGHVDSGIILCAFIGLGSLALRARWVRQTVAGVWVEVKPLFRDKWWRLVSVALCVLYWVDSIVPPRDGDVMRYHLAHVRQIIGDGRWVPLPDYTYALPFGWTINYLLFERLHLVEASHIVNLGLWLVSLAVISALLLRARAPTAAFLLLLFLALHPLVLKSATTAHADVYSVFAVLVIVLFLIYLPTDDRHQMALLGFAATIGSQTRYQLLGVSVVVFIIGMWYLVTKRISIRLFGAAMIGAAGGLIVASPFYIANYLAFHNPFWPLLVAKINGLQLYADRVADNVNRSLSGTYQLTDFLNSFRALLVDPIAFPIPLLALLSLTTPFWSRTREARVTALFSGLFLLIWSAAQPSLYSRFSMLLIPSTVISIGYGLRSLPGKRMLNTLLFSAGVFASAALFAFDLYYSKDSARYVATGDAARYHEATWFYPVYKWVNDIPPKNARFLVIVASGHSYYLDRSYRRADPFLSGYIDWDAVKSPQQLQDVLSCGHFDYVIYHTAAHLGHPGGASLDSAIRSAVDQGILTIVRTFELRLVTRRVSGEGQPALVWVLRPAGSSNASDCGSVRRVQPFLNPPEPARWSARQ